MRELERIKAVQPLQLTEEAARELMDAALTNGELLPDGYELYYSKTVESDTGTLTEAIFAMPNGWGFKLSFHRSLTGRYKIEGYKWGKIAEEEDVI